MVDFEGLLRALTEHGVKFVIVDGVAATVHGSARLTADLDVVYSRENENLIRLVRALAPHSPYLRGAPPGLPFSFDSETLASGLNFTLTSDLGPIDLLGDITGGGSFEDLLPDTIEVSLFGIDCLVVNLDSLIRLKRAAGRPRDLETIAELEGLREENA